MTPIMLGTPTMPPRASEISNLRGDKTFPHTAHDGLNNVTQRRNLTKATTTIRNKRQRVIDEIDDWEDLREAGSTTKRYVMAHLPELLEQFEAAVTARGGHVHWARNAEEAGKIVTELVQATGEDQVDGHPRNRPERAAGKGGHFRPGDRPCRAHCAAG